ncbi:hypothetical protein ID80_004802 [Salmonella enterica subsp. enterica serovar Ball]|nr:hypothetical protein [Salmonella enterica subsp. enterica serovar Minnesota]ECI4647471.1 hypothetical protein [Salmonella enterica subsp. salamae]EDV5024126.1 hypothetical protein [Salmonella enterica subsp. enterica serovar Ball]EGO7253114.1 hypothetical protein [Salmonella enterica]HCM1955413.1 hypothetical protein [Salmonella enterica subsp. salamae serovar 9,46:z4,z24:z39:z42]
MKQSLEQRILEYIRNRQPVNQATLLSELNIDRESYYAATMLLRKERKIITTGRGMFAGDDAFLLWQKKQRVHDSQV